MFKIISLSANGTCVTCSKENIDVLRRTNSLNKAQKSDGRIHEENGIVSISIDVFMKQYTVEEVKDFFFNPSIGMHNGK